MYDTAGESERRGEGGGNELVPVPVGSFFLFSVAFLYRSRAGMNVKGGSKWVCVHLRHHASFFVSGLCFEA